MPTVEEESERWGLGDVDLDFSLTLSILPPGVSLATSFLEHPLRPQNWKK